MKMKQMGGDRRNVATWVDSHMDVFLLVFLMLLAVQTLTTAICQMSI